MSQSTLTLLGVNSYSLDLDPDYGYEEKDKRIETVHRVRDGGLFVYKWGSFKGWKVPVSYVNSSFKSIINSWWMSGAELVLTTNSGTIVNSVLIRSKRLPVSKLIKPYNDLFKGTIDLETY